MLLVKAFLGLVGLLYVFLSLYCTFLPKRAAEIVHLAPRGPGGQSEFMTVYGGLEMGMALIFLAPWLNPAYTKSSLLACLMIHGCLVLFRLGSFTLHPQAFAATQSLAIGEIVILVLTLLLWWRAGYSLAG